MNGLRGRAWGLPLLGGVSLGLSYFPWPLLVLNLCAFVPLLAWFDAQRAASPWTRFKAGLVFGVAAELVMLHFMYSMLTWSWLAVVLYLGMSLAVGLRIAVGVVLLGWLRHRTRLPWFALLPVAWLPVEWLQSFGDLRMTGDLLAHSVANYPFLIQFADIVGPYGVGAVLLLFNALVYEALVHRGSTAGRRAAAALAMLSAVVLVYDGWAWTRPEPDGRSVRVGIVQPNVPLLVKRGDEQVAEQSDNLARQSILAAEQGAELIIWPETSRPFPLQHVLERPETRSMREVQYLAQQLSATLLVGVEYYRIRGPHDFDLYNAAMAVDAQGRLLDAWGGKIYLVPFVEAIPFKRLVGRFVEGKGGEWRWLAGGFDPGPRNVVFDAAGARVGVVVCYEEFFPDLARGLRNAGANIQVVITNDAWFGRSLFQPYMVNALRLRAIENRTSYVRAANTGISGFVDSRGRYHQRTALFEEAVEVRDVTLSDRRTVYGRFGDVVAWISLAGLIAAVVLAVRCPVSRVLP
jgi:apolipoprotein N-acyltransferase